MINISKSGATTETALTFRLLKKQCEAQRGKEEAKKVQSIKSVSSQQTSEEKIPEVQPAASTTEPAKVVAPSDNVFAPSVNCPFAVVNFKK